MIRFPSSCLAAALACSACASTPTPPAEPPIVDERPTATNVEVATLEIRGVGEDRFVACPPPGELGQSWIPPLPPWSPTRDGAREDADAQRAQARASFPGDAAPMTRAATESAITETFPDFRACHAQGLRADATQDGHVAIVARVGPDGKVARAEAYAACNLSAEVIACMRHRAAQLRFHPPAAGAMTVTIPAFFASRGDWHASPTTNDAYTAAAFVTVEQARPALHECEARARRAGAALEASATMMLTVDARGKVTAVHVEPWTGNADLLTCAAHAMQSLAFAPPPAGRGSVLTRVLFNPRAGSR